MNHVIEVKNLAVSYGNSPVLKEIDFQASAGEFVVIVGKSGCGKTTFINALAGLVPFFGEVKIEQKIGIVFQQNSVFPWLTAAENIGFGLDGYSAQEKTKIVDNHLALAGMHPEGKKYPAELSGGQIQRVALARSLANNSEVLLMDEPFGSLDEYTRGKMQEWLLNVWGITHKTIVFVTHNIEEAIFLADRVLIIGNGGLINELTIPFVRPRDNSIRFTEEFNRLRQEIHSSIR
ncbi:MAG: ABC transporter ATP-binding protein [Patescibacteria group bacterium]